MLAILSFHSAEYTARIGFGVFGKLAEVAGSEAVIVFFLISGFLLYRPYAAARAGGRPRPATSLYARRRALRILPGYWTVLTLLALFPGIVGVFTGDWWRYYGYLQLYFPQARGGGIAVAWTLCVEMTYYLALPIWALVVRRFGAGASAGAGLRGFLGAELGPLAVIIAGGIGVQVAVSRGHLPYTLGVSLIGQGAWICIGMAVAVLSVAVQHYPNAAGSLRALANRAELCWALGIGAAAGLVALVPTGGLFGLIASVDVPQSIPRTLAKLILEGLLAFLFVLPAVFGDQTRGLARRLLAWRPIVGLGVISYSFYLWHLTIVQLLALGRSPSTFSATGLDVLAHVHVARTLVLYVLSLAVTAAIATISYRVIELPFLRRKEKENAVVTGASLGAAGS